MMDDTVTKMDTANGSVNKPVDVASLDCKKVEDHGHVNGKSDSDSNSLLTTLPKRGGMARKLDKTCRRVQWTDTIGNKLVEVLEYEPSDVSDSDDEDSCICSIM
ncbi:hypothetical protein MtrunA17_Chr1g0186331 [Medicago truncatula]|uniref:Uncharacterized protein n=1 Tax=Medicago truncatula TaxID=3880 RepID=A0A072VM24_MEDTR|nr:uncharacterized protein LOC25484385 isoform X2 [Medicago truncatula]KEH42681.1 hypothetical protein MTR_1g073660 [Medicago truncatula]RHN80261.1 hypothetical protein MtrunA17_Chr1g0186331 [Medicago truncatula]